MKNLSKPIFIFGCISILISLVGFFMIRSEDPAAMYVYYTGLAFGGVFWIWSIIHVSGSHELRGYQKMFWLIVVISIPVLGGFLYLLMHQRRNRIVT